MSSAGASATLRPAAMKRASSQGQVPKSVLKSPGSELDSQPLRHAVRSKGHARVVLPRNHSSGRNLAKLARQVAAATGDNGATSMNRHHGRQRSHEGDTEIRLPGSLDESYVKPPPIRRNYTSSNLPRNASHTKLKKNLSHGQLHRMGNNREFGTLTSTARAKTPLSPAFKGKSKRMTSAELDLDKDLHTREVELAMEQQQRREAPKRVGFAVGSFGDDSDAEGLPNMEGSGLDEGEWTEESASASPYSTRENTANNSRRESIQQPEHLSPRSQQPSPLKKQQPSAPQESSSESDTESDDTDSTVPPTEKTEAQSRSAHKTEAEAKAKAEEEAEDQDEDEEDDDEEDEDEDEEDADEEADVDTESGSSAASHAHSSTNHGKTDAGPGSSSTNHIQPREPLREPSHPPTQHTNPTAQLLRRQSGQLTAPALISNVNVMDDTRSVRTSPTASLRSSRSNIAVSAQDADELVSRFVPSTSNGSGTTTTMQNTPKSGSFHTPDDNAFSRHRERNGFSLGPASPGSTVSGSSGATTPALGRSRIELKMLQEKAIADMEFAAERGPLVPAHVYDRRNESLKSYLQLASLSNNGGIAASSIPLSLGPEIFQGRFKAVNTELKVVQMFRDPVAESVSRLRARQNASKAAVRTSKRDASTLRTSKSAVTLPVRTAQKKETTPMSVSTSPANATSAPDTAAAASIAAAADTIAVPAANGKPLPAATKSSVSIKPTRRAPTRGVSFAGADEHREFERETEESSIDEIAKEMWDTILT